MLLKYRGNNNSFHSILHIMLSLMLFSTIMRGVESSTNAKDFALLKRNHYSEEATLSLFINDDNKCSQINDVTNNINYNEIIVCFDSGDEELLQINVTIKNAKRGLGGNGHLGRFMNIMQPYYISNQAWNCSDNQCVMNNPTTHTTCFPPIKMMKMYHCATRNCTLSQSFKATALTKQNKRIVSDRVGTTMTCEHSPSTDDGCPTPNAFLSCNTDPAGFTFNIIQINNQLAQLNFTNNSPYDGATICVYFNNCNVHAIANEEWVLTAGTVENLYYTYIGSTGGGLNRGETTCYLSFGANCGLDSFEYQAYFFYSDLPPSCSQKQQIINN